MVWSGGERDAEMRRPLWVTPDNLKIAIQNRNASTRPRTCARVMGYNNELNRSRNEVSEKKKQAGRKFVSIYLSKDAIGTLDSFPAAGPKEKL